jgi:hypothetical protein
MRFAENIRRNFNSSPKFKHILRFQGPKNSVRLLVSSAVQKLCRRREIILIDAARKDGNFPHFQGETARSAGISGEI